MRIDCKFYESRSYGTGETVRACRLNMAPEAPWRCPADCPTYERKVVDAGWTHGSLVNTPTGDEPELDNDSLALLGSAEEIINSVGFSTVAEVQAERDAAKAAERAAQARKRRRWWWPF